jgi:hypothetical protein
MAGLQEVKERKEGAPLPSFLYFLPPCRRAVPQSPEPCGMPPTGRDPQRPVSPCLLRQLRCSFGCGAMAPARAAGIRWHECSPESRECCLR